MKVLPLLLLFITYLQAQPRNDGRQLVALVTNYEPDKLGSLNEYLLLADKPACVALKPKQTFVLRSAWQSEGDSVANIGEGTFDKMEGSDVRLIAAVKNNVTIKKGDVALFLVPLKPAGKDSLINKLARFAISFTTITDSIFFDRNTALKNPSAFTTARIAKAMAADIQFTATQMLQQNDGQDQEITTGLYKGQKLFGAMQKTTGKDVTAFLRYVYARPDKYMAHTFKISETYATWLANGAPMVRGKWDIERLGY